MWLNRRDRLHFKVRVGKLQQAVFMKVPKKEIDRDKQAIKDEL